MMSQVPEAAEEFKQLMLAQPKVAFERLNDVQQFELQDEAKLKADFQANKDVYKALGVKETDLAYAKYIRTNRGVGEAVITG